MLEGIGPEQLRIQELALRVASEDITEVILCMNPNIEGETTAGVHRHEDPAAVRDHRHQTGLGSARWVATSSTPTN